MILGEEKGLVLVLAVKVDEEGGELGEIGAEGALVLDICRAAAVGLYPPPDENPALFGLEAPRAKPLLGLRVARHVEDAGDQALLGARANYARVRLGAEEEADRAYEEGLACARLAREEVQAPREAYG